MPDVLGVRTLRGLAGLACCLSACGCAWTGSDKEGGGTAASSRPLALKPLPCPRKPMTTRHLEGCAGRELRKTDAAVEAAARRVRTLLRPRARRAFAAAERCWRDYRARVCAVETSPYQGGSIRPTLVAHCLTRHNRGHVRDLTALQQALAAER